METIQLTEEEEKIIKEDAKQFAEEVRLIFHKKMKNVIEKIERRER